MTKLYKKYQLEFAKWFSMPTAFSFWKGRVGLYVILRALRVGPGDEVILPGYTCVMDVNPIKYLSAKPVYVDIEPNTYNMNVDLLEDKITATTKVIIAQHTYGYPCDMDAILAIAARKGVSVIEDCCLAFGSKYKGKLVGSFGKAAYFSSQWNKFYTTGVGGMAVVNDQQLADKIAEIFKSDLCTPSAKEVFMLAAQLAVYRAFIYPRTTAFAQRLFRFLTKKGVVVGSSGTCEFEPVMAYDFLKVMSSIQARSGIAHLKKADRNISHRIEMAKLYDELLVAKGFQPRKYDSSTMEPVMVRYPVRITQKEKALEAAVSAGVELGSWFECPLHPIETPLQKYDYEPGQCPQAEKASAEVVNLPLHPRAGEKTVRRTVDFIASYTQAD